MAIGADHTQPRPGDSGVLGQLAVGLGQVGEFSFVLAGAAVALGLIDGDLFAAILGTVVASIVASTVLVRRVGGTPRPEPAVAG